MRKALLTKYWLSFNEATPYPLGVGVTAYSLEDAEAIIAKRLFMNGYVPAFNQKAIESLDDLEQNHVLPNIGLITFRGIWFPKTEPENR